MDTGDVAPVDNDDGDDNDDVGGGGGDDDGGGDGGDGGGGGDDDDDDDDNGGKIFHALTVSPMAVYPISMQPCQQSFASAIEVLLCRSNRPCSSFLQERAPYLGMLG